MEMNFKISDVLNIIAFFIGLLYSFQILTLKNRTTSKNAFIVYLLNITFLISYLFIIYYYNQTKQFGYFVFGAAPMLIAGVMAMPVNLWVYLNDLVGNKGKKKRLRHYIPSIVSGAIIFILMIIGNLIEDNELKQFFISIITGIIIGLMCLVFPLLNVFYVFLSFKLLKKHKFYVENNFSYTQDVDLKWVKVMLWGYLLLLGGLVVTQFFENTVSLILFYSVLIVYFVFIGQHALKQQDIEIDENTTPEITKEVNAVNQFSESQKELFENLKEKLLHLMNEEKPYLQNDLTSAKLAKMLNTNTKYLSHIINNDFNKSFISFINQYRIEDVKKNLLENNHLTIEGLAQNAGFKSKSAFNAAFKKETGMTPSSYKETYQ